MKKPIRRLPAEWEPHKATWLAWPHNRKDWPGKFGPIPWVWAEIVRLLHTSETVHILCHNERIEQEARDCCKFHHVNLRRCRFHIVPNDRCWLRDSGAIGIYDSNGFLWTCWKFNAWAKYKNFKRDRCVPETMWQLSGHLGRAVFPGYVLEGGGIETNGKGVLLVTEEWLLSDEQVRNPGMTRKDYEDLFKAYFGIHTTIWLGKGCVGDDTHGHIDDVARFVDEKTIVLSYERNVDDENYPASQDNWKRLTKVHKSHGIDTIKLPYPRPIYFNGVRVPASYANFYIANKVVLVPTFNDPNDKMVLTLLSTLFPGRRVVGIHALDLVWGFGTLHCLTQQQPL